MLEHLLLIELIYIFVQRFKNRAISQINDTWNQSIILDVYCDL